MLIGISGKMGSGKNLVCTIIQGLTAAKKHNIENPSFEWIKKYYINSIWEQKAFAGKLKQTASLLTGIPVEKFEDQDFKNKELSEEWWYYKTNFYSLHRGGQMEMIPYAEYEALRPLVGPANEENLIKLTPRLLLQFIGTDCIRDKVHPNAWVNALFADYKYEIHRSEVSTRAAGFIDQHVYPNWIITDMRFPNELEAVKSRGGITIRVNRPGLIESNHLSETSLDSATFDFVISNDKDIEHLINEVRKILEKLNII